MSASGAHCHSIRTTSKSRSSSSGTPNHTTNAIRGGGCAGVVAKAGSWLSCSGSYSGVGCGSNARSEAEQGVSGLVPSSSSVAGGFRVGVRSTWRSWFGGRGKAAEPFSSPDSPESRSSRDAPSRFGCSSTGKPSPDSAGGCCCVVGCWLVVTGPAESRSGESSLSSLAGVWGEAASVGEAVGLCRKEGGRVSVLWNWGGSLRMFLMSSITSRSTRPLYRRREPLEKNPPPVVTDGTSLEDGMVK